MSTKPLTSINPRGHSLKDFIKYWHLDKEVSFIPRLKEWMEDTYVNPLYFWNELFVYNDAAIGLPRRSVPFESYNFYYDCIYRHLEKNPTAIKIIESNKKSISFSYKQIHSLVNIQCTIWQKEGKLTPGQIVIFVIPYGIHFIVALMTALRLGLSFYILPPEDRFLGTNKLLTLLKSLESNKIITIDPYHELIGENSDLFILDIAANAAPEASTEFHTYVSGDIVQRFSSTFLDANASYLYPLRDATLNLKLRHNSTFATPLASLTQEEPFCTFMALLCGATIVYAADKTLLLEPECLKGENIEVLGVSEPLAKIWIQVAGCPTNKPKLWYKNPLLGNTHLWTAFTELNSLKKTPSADCLIQLLKGGMVLCSKPKPYDEQPFLYPSLGMPWKLLQLNESKDIAIDGTGFFHVESSLEKEDQLILSQIREAWIISHLTNPAKEGVFYPIDEVEDSINQLNFVIASMIIPQRNPLDLFSSLFSLIIFISPKAQSTSEQQFNVWRQMITNMIKKESGDVFSPDQILFYPFYPKFIRGSLNRNVTLAQFQGGMLSKKNKSSLHHVLNRFREMLYETIRGPS